MGGVDCFLSVVKTVQFIFNHQRIKMTTTLKLLTCWRLLTWQKEILGHVKTLRKLVKDVHQEYQEQQEKDYSKCRPTQIACDCASIKKGFVVMDQILELVNTSTEDSFFHLVKEMESGTYKLLCKMLFL